MPISWRVILHAGLRAILLPRQRKGKLVAAVEDLQPEIFGKRRFFCEPNGLKFLQNVAHRSVQLLPLLGRGGNVGNSRHFTGFPILMGPVFGGHDARRLHVDAKARIRHGAACIRILNACERAGFGGGREGWLAGRSGRAARQRGEQKQQRERAGDLAYRSHITFLPVWSFSPSL